MTDTIERLQAELNILVCKNPGLPAQEITNEFFLRLISELIDLQGAGAKESFYLRYILEQTNV